VSESPENSVILTSSSATMTPLAWRTCLILVPTVI